jgi:hypothetical protein
LVDKEHYRQRTQYTKWTKSRRKEPKNELQKVIRGGTTTNSEKRTLGDQLKVKMVTG